MNEQLLETTVRRLDELERQNRQLRRIVMVMAAAAVVAFVSSFDRGTTALAQPAKPQVVRAQKFVVEDDNGKQRVEIGWNPKDGASYLNLWDENGSWRGGLAAGKGFGHIIIRDSNDTERFKFYESANGTAMELNDRTGTKVKRLYP